MAPERSERIERLSKHLNSVGKSTAGDCPVCGSNGWAVAGSFTLGPTFPVTEVVRTLPVEVVMCTTCFYLRLFSTKAIAAAAEAGKAGPSDD